MNFHEYESLHFVRYQRFAEVVRAILERAIAATGNLPPPQSIQARAKTPASLRKRLEEARNLDADVAAVRRDLAGVRLIFYTNNDVDRFLNSSIVFDNFNVDRNATKVHHPIQENGEIRYQAIHYTVSLNDAREALPEYQEFAGLRCEIQIQTILIHAWAETSHDIIYKVDDRQGFGNEALAQIRKRFDRIMDKYLMPAGYAFQRVQQDYERLVAGKQLFDQDLLESLRNAGDNNERYDLVASLADDLLPLYDDVPSIFPEVLEVLVEVVTKARTTPVRSIETPFSTYSGYEATDVIEKAVEIVDRFRYAAIEDAFVALQQMFAGETEERIRQRIVDAVGHLSQYNLKTWAQVGPGVQQRLAAVIQEQKHVSVEVRPLVIETWKHILDAEARGNTWSADSVSLEFGEVPIASVQELRQTAIEALFKLFENAVDDRERRNIFHALDNATRTANRGRTSNEFLRQTLVDHRRIVEFLSVKAPSISYELCETIEHSALYDYYRVGQLLGARGAEMGCQDEAAELAKAILVMRDRFNEDTTYFRYKILVGFEGAMPWQWEDRDFKAEKVGKYRDEQSAAMLDEVSDDNRSEWLSFLERCAATRSDDLATFPKLGQFIVKLSERYPAIAEFMLENGNDDLLRFLPGFLNGLYQCKDHTIYRNMLTQFLSRAGHLASIALHWRGSNPDDPETLRELLRRSLEEDDRQAIAECAVFVMRSFPDKVPPHDELFRPSLRHLIAAEDPNWIRLAFLPEKTAFFDNLNEIDAGLILDSLVELPALSYDAEQLLSYVAEGHLGLVWDFLGRRFEHPREESDELRYEAVPHHLQLLNSRLSSDVGLAIQKLRTWFNKDPALFRYRGGRLLAEIFRLFSVEVANALLAQIGAGTVDDAKFILGVMQNFHGEPATHPVLKALLRKFPDNEQVRLGVAGSIENTGVVHGEFGFVDSLREKKKLIEPWLDDGDAVVAEFARGQIAKIDRDILAEKRRADASSAIRRLEFDEDGDHQS